MRLSISTDIRDFGLPEIIPRDMQSIKHAIVSYLNQFREKVADFAQR